MTLILASKSASRRAMLEAAGVQFRCEPADIDERAFERLLADRAPRAVVLALAELKAMAIEPAMDIVLGSDSIVSVDGRRFDKPDTPEEAEAHLRFFSGRTMELHSAAALNRGSELVWSYAAVARMKVRDLSDDFIETYLDVEWPAVAGCVGVFRIEGLGVQLFEKIEGDHFTVLGMPLLPVLAALRDLGELPT